MNRVTVFALAISLSGAPAIAQSLRTEPAPAVLSLKDSARLEAAKFALAVQGSSDDAYRPGGMPPAYFWTSIGLMAAGGIYLANGALWNTVDDGCDDFEDDFNIDLNCNGVGTGVMVMGAGLIGAGAVVYFLGKKKAAAAGNPQIVPTARGVAVRSRYSF